MIALLLAAAFVDAFWARDLGALTRELAEDPSRGEERMFFDDLLRLTTCSPLEKLQEQTPLRVLVRVEEARRFAPGTLWDDVQKAGFFKLTPWNPDDDKLLRWPDEKERWPNETLLVPEMPWQCLHAKKGTGPLPLLQPALLRSLPPEVAARAIYERAVLRYRQGALEGIAEIDPALLTSDLRFAARFLRLEAGVDGPDGWADLARAWPHPAIAMRAAQRLFETKQYVELVQLPAPEPKASAMLRHVFILRGLAFHAIRRDRDMVQAFAAAFAQPGTDKDVEPLRALAIQALAKEPFDSRLVARVATSVNGGLEQLAHQALAAGNYDTAMAAAQRLADDPDLRWRSQGLVLVGETAFRSGDVEKTFATFARIFEPAQKLGGFRDPAAVQLAQALVVTDAQRGDPARGRALASELDAVRRLVRLKAVPQIDELLTAVRRAAVQKGEQPVALGEVTVTVTPPPPSPPKIEIELPEPRSLLAIPAQDGTLRDWFDDRGSP